MIRHLKTFCIIGIASILTVSSLAVNTKQVGANKQNALAKGFKTPPDSAKSWVYWWWLEGNVTRLGITKDLKEMKRQGINGALVFTAGIPAGPLPMGVKFLSPEWHELFRHALKEADRLHMVLSVSLCDGWCSGGSWIKPEEANKKLVYSEVQVEGGKTTTLNLPKPPTFDGYYQDIATFAILEKPNKPVVPIAITAKDSIYGADNEARWPEFATDGDPYSCWSASAPSAGQPMWIQLRYDGAITAESIYIVPGPSAGPRDCDLQVSTDGIAFHSVSKFTLESNKSTRVPIPTTTSSVFRLVISSSYASPAPVQLAELVILRKGDEPLIRPGIRNWAFKSANMGFWDWATQAPSSILSKVYADKTDTPDVDSDRVIDISTTVDKNGQMNWKVFPGRWTIMRFGYTLEGQRTRASSAGGPIGYEADMLSTAGIKSHFKNVVDPIMADVKATGSKALKYFHIDSYEVGADVGGQQPTWSEELIEMFESRRGYDPLPYLPALAHRIIDSQEDTERFLWDYRQTIADLFAEKFWKTYADLAHEYGVKVHGETGYGTFPYPHLDALRTAGHMDSTMGEFWQGSDVMSRFNVWGNVIRNVASAAHIYDRPIVQAESFTSWGSWSHWRQGPTIMKPVGDEAFCDGLNRIVFHQYTMQPTLADKPGIQYFAGTHVDRFATWWEQGRSFFDYLNRCQYMLQQGLFNADVAYFVGEDTGNYVPGKEYLKPSLPAGYNYDGINADVLLHRATMKNGRLTLPNGMNYRLLVLPDHTAMTPELAYCLRDFVQAGLTVLGPKPTRSPSMMMYPEGDERVREVGKALWGKCDGKSITENRVGKGRVFWGKTPQEVLRLMKIAPDFDFSSKERLTEDLEGASWIWHAADGANPPPGKRTFKGEFVLPANSKIARASVAITCDNSFVLLINGHAICRSNEWANIQRADLSKVLLPGRNSIVIEATNGIAGVSEPSPAGLIAKVEVGTKDGGSFLFTTGKNVMFSREGEGKWTLVSVVGAYGVAPWGRIQLGLEGPAPILRWIHRTTKDAEIYFIANRSNRTLSNVDCTFRTSKRQPELWDPVTGEMKTASRFVKEADVTRIPLTFAPYQSRFVVFTRAIPPHDPRDYLKVLVDANDPSPIDLSELPGHWTVSFDPKWGGPSKVVFERLADWTTRPEDGIKYYSGTATYSKSFDLPKYNRKPRTRLFLDLGVVKEQARVRLNGKDLGVVWTAPWRVEITSAVQVKNNRIEIEVVNYWPNRLIGDASLPADKRFTKGNVTLGADDQLMPSGLLGPVKLLISW